MTTVINTPPATGDAATSGISNIIITILILGSLLFVGVYYVVPMIRNSRQPAKPNTATLNIEVPLLSPTNQPTK